MFAPTITPIGCGLDHEKGFHPLIAQKIIIINLTKGTRALTLSSLRSRRLLDKNGEQRLFQFLSSGMGNHSRGSGLVVCCKPLDRRYLQLDFQFGYSIFN